MCGDKKLLAAMMGMLSSHVMTGYTINQEYSGWRKRKPLIQFQWSEATAHVSEMRQALYEAAADAELNATPYCHAQFTFGDRR